MKLSIIVPVYKVEQYIHRCVDSILAQTFTDYELILVDDGSPDRCGEICDEYARKDPRVKVIHKKNGGLSDARNAGLDNATGEWLSFVDSDDWIEPDMLEKLLINAQKHRAMISVGSVAAELLEESGVYTRIHPQKTTNNQCTVLETEDALHFFFQNAWAAWDKIYRRDVFDGIRYPVGEINEDEAIALFILDRADRVVYTEDEVYHYVVRPESITTSSFSAKKLAWVKHCRDNLAFIREKYPQLEEYALQRYRSSILWSLREIALSDQRFDKEIHALKNQLKENDRLFSKAAFRSNGERLRYYMMRWLPFGIIRVLLRHRHRK